MEKLILVFIIIHASFGGLALLAGLVSVIAKKGQKVHKRSGIVFFYAMMINAITALLISVAPNHHSPFLFAIGIFSLYFILSGKRALRFKYKNPNLIVDRVISGSMLITGVLMIILPIVLANRINSVLAVFGAVAILFTIRDLILFRQPDRLKKAWLNLHLGKMLGGYIAATTAFVVVNDFFPGIYGWFIPGIIGGFVIAYWIRKLKGKKVIPNSL